MGTVAKAHLARVVTDELGLPMSQAQQMVNAAFAGLASSIMEGRRIEIRGFGTFKVVRRAARTGRNPRAGTHIEIPPRSAPAFKPSREIRARVNQDEMGQG